LHITDELVGRQVRCPTCSHIFQAPNGQAPDVPLEMASPPTTPEDHLDVVLEVPELPEEELPEVDAPRRRDERQRGRAKAKEGEGRRRDQAAHRGGTLQVMGIISLVMSLLACPLLFIPWVLSAALGPEAWLVGVISGTVAWVIGIVVGALAWAMGSGDLAQMREGTMDRAGENSSYTGYMCGIVGTFLNLVLMLSCGGVLGVLSYQDSERKRQQQAAPQQPAAGKAIKDKW
jgi:hypothetical protein